jgi:hypothetical protein
MVEPAKNRMRENVSDPLDRACAGRVLPKQNVSSHFIITHPSDQVAHLFADPRSTTERSGLPSPVNGKAHSMPTHDRLRPDDGYGVKNARTATIEPNEQGTVGPTQMQSTWCALLYNNELMPQYQDFGFQPPPRLEGRKGRQLQSFIDHVLIRSDRESNGLRFRKRQLGTVFGALARHGHARRSHRALAGLAEAEHVAMLYYGAEVA